MTLVMLQITSMDELGARVSTTLSGAGLWALDALIALAIVLIGWAIARGVAVLLRSALRTFRFNDGIHSLLGETPLRYEPAALAAWGTQWQAAVTRLANGALVKGFPFELTREPLTISRAAPKVGADTQEVLQRIAGYTAGQTKELLVQKVIEEGLEPQMAADGRRQ